MPLITARLLALVDLPARTNLARMRRNHPLKANRVKALLLLHLLHLKTIDIITIEIKKASDARLFN